MSCYKRTITQSSDELDFIKGFINSLTLADRRITCPTDDLDEQYAQTGTPPSFTINVGDAGQLVFTRRYNVNIQDQAFYVSDSLNRFSATIVFNGNNIGKNDICIRTWKYRIISNDEALRLDLASYNGDTASPIISMMAVKNGDESYAAAGNSSSAVIGNSFISGEGEVVAKKDRLPYSYDADSPADIELIKSKVFVTGNSGDRCFVLTDMYDVSTVPASGILSIGGKDYFALDAHTVMEV